MRNAENIALSMSGLIYRIAKLFTPAVWLFTVSTNGILRLFKIDPNAIHNENAEEEIRMILDAGQQSGMIDPEEQSMIHNIFEFDDTYVREIMTHRTEVALLWSDESDEQWEQTIIESSHSIYPVCGESPDHILGVLYTKDYLRLKDRSRKNVMKNAVHKAHFIPESVHCDVLFRHMKKTRNHFAVITDEFGGMSGIVTMNDLLEELVGDIDDDFSKTFESPLIERLDSKTWKIRGTAPLDDISKQLGVDLPDTRYDTFGGLVFGILGAVPQDGSTPEIEEFGLQIKVKKIKDRRLELALVYLTEPQDEEE